MISGDTDAVHTVAVWYSGGGSPVMGQTTHFPHMGPMEMHDGHGDHAKPELANVGWTYFSGRVSRETPVEAHDGKEWQTSTRTYTNDDVARVAAKSEPFTKK